MYLLVACLLIAFTSVHGDLPCAGRDYGGGSIVCVCNSTYCDTVTVTRPVPLHSVSSFTSSKGGDRFGFVLLSLKNISTKSEQERVTINIFSSKKYQTVKGFGAALTDAASINILSLSSKAQQQLLKSYFSSNGIEYNMIRVPIASCDYSTREYTYLDTPNDYNLSTFALAKEDLMYKIPLLKSIYQLSTRQLSLYGSPWTAPAWMKTSDNEIGRGWLKGSAGDKYHKTWAQYFVKFFDEYKKHGISFWGVTAQNEPSNGLLEDSTWQSTGFSPEMQRDFVKLDLGPALVGAGYGNIKLMILDDQRMFLPNYPATVLNDPGAAKYVSGIGVHWYWNWLASPELLQATHDKFPDVFILATEACNKDSPGPDLGNWEDGVKYSNDILDNLNNWSVGWVDWNMCLNLQGGPNWAKNFDDSPIIVNGTGDEFYKQPMYYHLGHFSKFVTEGSVRIGSSINASNTGLKFVAFHRPDGNYVLIVLNPTENTADIDIVHGNYKFTTTVPVNGIQSFFWSEP